MSNPALPTRSNSSGANPAQAGEAGAASPFTFEENLQRAWEQNRSMIIGLCVVVLLAIAGSGAWRYLAAQRELQIEQDYAKASNPAELQAFIAAQPGHELTGIAELRVADEAYASGDLAAALVSYDLASSSLQTPVLAARARLGAAIAQIQSGQANEGMQTLKQLADDPKQFQALRAEAAYHLASLAAAAGQADQVRQLSAQLLQIDPQSPWTQRAFALQESLPAAAAPAPAAGGSPAISFPAAAK